MSPAYPGGGGGGDRAVQHAAEAGDPLGDAALALGNAVILKPDPRTPVSGGVVLARVFEEAGLPAGVLHVLPGGGELGAAMVAHRDVNAVSFTGSTEAGRSVGERPHAISPARTWSWAVTTR